MPSINLAMAFSKPVNSVTVRPVFGLIDPGVLEEYFLTTRMVRYY